jgi:phosphate:Na+ symporter
MDIVFDILSLFCGLALFLYGMEVMGDSLKKSAGNQLKMILGKMTSSPIRGFLLGLAVTAVIQSSSATTVMVVGFVNSGTMTLLQSVGVIMGANVGTAVTAWLTALSSLGGDSAVSLDWVNWLKPDAWMPVLAVIGICLLMFAKRGKKKDVGHILLGFAVLMVGMELMSGAVKDYGETLKPIFTMFSNPILGVIAGLVLTVIVQSSSASVGILQSLTMTGAISYGAAIPIIMGQNIGTCVTALISSISANKNGKRAAMIHLYFNIIGVVIWLSVFYIVNAIFSLFPTDTAINAWGVAGVHTVFKMLSVLAIAPFYKQLEKLAIITIREKKDKNETVNKLDERLFDTPSIAVEQATVVTREMAEISVHALKKSLALFDEYDVRSADEIRELEDKADKLEDALGSYLVKLSGCDIDDRDAMQITKLLHIIGDLERISDHAVNVVESAEEMRDKKLSFSPQATKEMLVMRSAVDEILDISLKAFLENDVSLAEEVEPIEEVVDDLRDQIKLNHIIRLQKSECTIEHGFVLSDLLTNFERVSDHCSNIAGCVIEISRIGALDMHRYSEETSESVAFKQKYVYYQQKYKLEK